MRTAELVATGLFVWHWVTLFLFAVARWGQRNPAATTTTTPDPVSIRCREMGTAERARQASPAEGLVSIRCREMGTAELRVRCAERADVESFYSLSRDGDSGTRPASEPS